MRAAVYLRISQDPDGTGLAIDRQREDCMAIVKANGWTLVDEPPYEDTESASDARKERPHYNRLIADYDAGKFGALVCYDLDRLTRQPRQLEDWIDRAEQRGLVIVTANGEADLRTDGGRMYARVKAAVAKAEVERKSQRQIRAHVQRSSLGKPPKGVRPLGYDLDGGTIEHERDAVKAIYKAFMADYSIRAIARALSGQTGPDVAAGVPHVQAHTLTLAIERNARRVTKGLPARDLPETRGWHSSTVLGILRNPRYAGYSVYTSKTELARGERRRVWRDSIVRDPETNEPVMGRWEAFIDPDEWERVQTILDNPGRKTNKEGTERKHLGSGIYVCGLCGATMTSASRGYRCRRGCFNRTGKPIDQLVRATIADVLADPELHEKVVPDNGPRLQLVAADIAKAEHRIARAQRDYDEEFIEGVDLKRVRAEQNAIIAELIEERTRLLAPTGLASLLADGNASERFLKAGLGAQRATIELLAKITVFPSQQGRKGFDPASVDIEPRF